MGASTPKVCPPGTVNRHQSTSPGTGLPGTSQPVTGQLTGQPGTGLPGTVQPFTRQITTIQPGTGLPGTGQVLGNQSPVIWYQVPVTGHPVTGHLAVITRHRAFRHQSVGNQSLVTRHQSTYQAPVLRQQSIGTEYRVASQTHRSSEHSLSNEPQNSTTSKRILLPLEPDFSGHRLQ